MKQILADKYPENHLSFKRKRGSALVLVIVLFLVISIFAVAMLGMATTETQLVVVDHKADQAYLVARSVVDSTYEWIAHHYLTDTDLNKVIPLSESGVSTSTGSLNGHTYSLSVTKKILSPSEQRVTIRAVATNGSVNSSAKLSVIVTNSSIGLFEDAIYSKTAFGKLAGSPVIWDGNVSTASEILPTNFDFKSSDSNTYQALQKVMTFLPITVPDTVRFTDPGDSIFADYTINNGDTLTLTGDATFSSLNLKGTLAINNSDPNKDYYVVINGNFGLDSGCEIAIMHSEATNGGRVFIFANGTVDSKSKLSITMPDALTSQPLCYVIFNNQPEDIVNDPIIFNLHGNPYLSAFIYAPFYNVVFEGGGNPLYNFIGALIANNYSSSGTSVVFKHMDPDLDNSPFAQMIASNQTKSVSQKTWLLAD